MLSDTFHTVLAGILCVECVDSLTPSRPKSWPWAIFGSKNIVMGEGVQ